MKVLVVGAGARAHTLAWALSRHADVSAIVMAPGNGGVRFVPRTRRVPIAVTAVSELVSCARQEEIDLAVVGPEIALAAGLSDALAAAHIPVFGASRAAARLESSKVFAKGFMQRHGIPTAEAQPFTTVQAALAHADARRHEIVVKADGLASGKGVLLPQSRTETRIALEGMLEQGQFGEAGRTVLIEDRMTGWEASVFALADGLTYRLFAHAQDYKRIFDGDQGPNTGGMGAVSPSRLTSAEMARIDREIVAPTFEGLQREGIVYAGVLFFGLMMTAEGPRVVEYNARLGDPETQVILPRLASDMAEVALACAQGRLQHLELAWHAQATVGVVMASAGYPGTYETGMRISGLSASCAEDTWVFLAGAAETVAGDLVTDGGRVLSVVGMGVDRARARAAAYNRVQELHFEGAQYRHDIGA